MENLMSLFEMEEMLMTAVQGLSLSVVVATVITSLTPSKTDDMLLNRALAALNILAGNVGHNRNADDH